MHGSKPTTRLLKSTAAFVGMVAIVIIGLPLLFLTLVFGRVVLIAVLAICLVALAASPELRRWLSVNSGLTHYKGIRIPSDRWLHPNHTWTAKDNRSELTVGVDDLLSSAIGPLDEVELPLRGAHISAGEPLATVRRENRKLQILAPFSCVVRDVNEALRQSPELIRDAPYERGWIAKLTAENIKSARRGLKQGRSAHMWFHDEIDRLVATLAQPHEGFVTSFDGGILADDLYQHVNEKSWQRLRTEFFGNH